MPANRTTGTCPSPWKEFLAEVDGMRSHSNFIASADLAFKTQAGLVVGRVLKAILVDFQQPNLRFQR